MRRNFRTMLSSLPLDIFRSLVEEYLCLDVKGLSSIDISFCNRLCRPDLLALLAQVRTHDEQQHTEPLTLESYLNWLASRGVRVPKLQLELDALAQGPLSVGQPVLGVEHIAFTGQPSIEAAHMGSALFQLVLQFLHLFPSLRLLGCWASITDSQLLTVQRLFLLDGLDLTSSYSSLTSDGIAACVSSLGSAMRTLKCARLDEDGLAAIAEQCHCFTSLDFGCSRLCSYDSLVHLCAMNAHSLQHLSLQCGSGLDDLIARIATSCPHLVSFRGFVVNAVDSAPAALCLLAHCPAVQLIELRDLIITVRRERDIDGNRNERKFLDISCPILPHYQDQVAFLSQLSLPVRACRMIFADESAAAASLLCLGRRFGPALESLDLRLTGMKGLLKTAQYVRPLLECSPNLTSLKLCPFADATLFEQLSVLPATCPKLRKLSIVTDFNTHFYGNASLGNVLTLLDAFKASPNNVVCELELPNKVLALTATTLNAIADAFPRLHAFSCAYNVVNKDALLDLMLSGRWRARRTTVCSPAAEWIAGQLRQRGFHHTLDMCHLSLPL